MGQKTKDCKYGPAFSCLLATMIIWLISVPAAADSAAKASFEFDGWAGPGLRVFATRPASLTPERPVVFVMHGMGRNADEYRDQWHQLALENRFLLIVPEFSENSFPGTDAYNIGNVFDQDGAPVSRELWSFSAIEPLFDAVRERFGMIAVAYSIYGHSAGAQIVSSVSTNQAHLEKFGLELSVIKGTVSLDTAGYDIGRVIGNGGVLAQIYINAFTGNPDTWREASPVFNISPGKSIPPFFIVTRGTTFRTSISYGFATALENAGVSAQILHTPQLSHEEVNRFTGYPGDTVITPSLMAFLEQLL